MDNSINLERMVDDLSNQVTELRQVGSELYRQNELLKEMLVDEVGRRKHFEKRTTELSKECKDVKHTLYRIQNELGTASRKEELVKSLRSILSNIHF